jgi:hypothetical protein
MHSIVSSARQTIICRSNAPKEHGNNSKYVEKSKKIFNDFHKKRSETFKLNSNDFVKVSQQEISEVGAFLKELDTFHREQFNEIKDAIEKKTNVKQSTTNKDAEASVVVDVTVESEENIFLKN